MSSLILKSKRIITPQGMIDGVVIVENGIIKEVLEGGDFLNDSVIDLGENVVMPGVIDPHVHINEPGRTEWEGFETATMAALAGGVTTLVDMPLNSSPVTTTARAFDEKIAASKNKLHNNVYFWGGLVPGNQNEIVPLIEKGVLGFKAFLTHSGIDEFPNVTEDDLRISMPVIARYGLPLLVHCELTDEIIRAKGATTSYQNYLSSRPKEWEDKAIQLMIQLCEETGCRVHIVHLSSANSIAAIKHAKEKGLPITVETAQHYLYFNAEDIPDGNTAYKCAPPIRERANNEQLWQALKDGIIDFVATDHSPATPDKKEIDSGNLMQAWGGIASIQLALPVLWTAGKCHDISLPHICKWLCENPAKLIGKENQIGKIAPGFDADIIVWNDKEEWTVDAQKLFHKNKLTPYDHQKLTGVVKRVFLKGCEQSLFPKNIIS